MAHCSSIVRLAVATQVLLAASAFAAPKYRAVDLSPALGTNGSGWAAAVNDQGLVAINTESGLLYDVESEEVVYRFRNGDVVESLSDNGNAAGTSPEGGWMLRRGIRIELPQLRHALGINDEGQVVGFCGGLLPRACTFDPWEGLVSDLPAHGSARSIARAINAVGQIAGEAALGDYQTSHAVRWLFGSMKDLSRSQDDSAGYAIDHKGRVAGRVGDRAALFEGRRVELLGTNPQWLRSVATGINSRKVAVGFAENRTTFQSCAVLFAEGRAFDLNELLAPRADGFTYARATGINEDGVIVGYAEAPDGGSIRPFVLVPDGKR